MSAGSHPALDPMMEAIGPTRILWTCDEPGVCAITARSKNGRPFLVVEYVKAGGFEVFAPVTEANDIGVTKAALESYVEGRRRDRVVHMASALDALETLKIASVDLSHLLEVIDQEAEPGVGDRPGDHMAESDLGRGQAALSRVDSAIDHLKAALGIDR